MKPSKISVQTMVALALLGGVACREAPTQEETPVEDQARPGSDLRAEPRALTLDESERVSSFDARDQYQLVAALAGAMVAEPERLAGSLETLRRDWQGKRYRWEVAVSPGLCRGPESCVVLPFDHGRSEQRIVQGWLPRLSLDAATHAALRSSCETHALCVVTIEATLAEFVLSAEDPTSLRFDSVAIAAARSAAAGESWVRRKTDPRVAKLRTSSANR